MDMKTFVASIIAITSNLSVLILLITINVDKKSKTLKNLIIVLTILYLTNFILLFIDPYQVSGEYLYLQFFLIIIPATTIIHYSYLTINSYLNIKRNKMIHLILLLSNIIVFIISPLLIKILSSYQYNIYLSVANMISTAILVHAIYPVFCSYQKIKETNKRNFHNKVLIILVVFILGRFIDDIIAINRSYYISSFIYHIFYIFLSQAILYMIIRYHYNKPKYESIKTMDDFVYHFQISQREQQVLCHAVKGKTYKEIAEELFISYETVKSHIRNIYKKTNIHTKRKLKEKVSSLTR